MAAGPAVPHAALHSICCSHAGGEGQQPRERQSCKSPSLHRACDRAHTWTLAEVSSHTRNSPTASAPRGRWSAQGVRTSLLPPQLCRFWNLKQLVQIHLCFFIKNGSCSDLPIEALADLTPWGGRMPKLHHSVRSWRILAWGCSFLRDFVGDKSMQTRCNFK